MSRIFRMKPDKEIGINTGSWNCHDAIFLLFEEVSSGILRSTKEYSLVYIPALNEWRGDVIAYGEWGDVDQEEIAEFRAKYSLDALLLCFTI